MPGCHWVAAGDARWRDGLWEMYLCRQRGHRVKCDRLTPPSTAGDRSLLLLDENRIQTAMTQKNTAPP